MEQELPNRKTTRWDQKDYSAEGKYFITICTEGRKPILSRISSVGVDVLDDPRNMAQPLGINPCSYKIPDIFAFLRETSYKGEEYESEMGKDL